MTTVRLWDRKLLTAFLKQEGIDVNQRDEHNGNTALIYAAHINHQSAVRRLLALGADVSLRATNTQTGHTALTEACHQGYIKIVKILLDHPGINVNQKVGFGYTALMRAACDAAIVRLLLAAGANPDLTNEYGETALMRSFMNEEAAQLLLDAGSDVNITDQYGENALFRPFPPQIMRAILAAGAKPNLVNHQSFGGCTPVLCAANRDSYENVSALLAAGADPTIRARNGHDAIQYARSVPVYNLIQRNLKHRAALDFALVVGRCPTLDADVLSHLGTFLGCAPVRDMILSVQRIHTRE